MFMFECGGFIVVLAASICPILSLRELLKHGRTCERLMAYAKVNFRLACTGDQSTKHGKIKLTVNESFSLSLSLSLSRKQTRFNSLLNRPIVKPTNVLLRSLSLFFSLALTRSHSLSLAFSLARSRSLAFRIYFLFFFFFSFYPCTLQVPCLSRGTTFNEVYLANQIPSALGTLSWPRLH